MFKSNLQRFKAAVILILLFMVSVNVYNEPVTNIVNSKNEINFLPIKVAKKSSDSSLLIKISNFHQAYQMKPNKTVLIVLN